MVVSDWLIVIGGLLFIIATADAIKTEIEYRKWWKENVK